VGISRTFRGLIADRTTGAYCESVSLSDLIPGDWVRDALCARPVYADRIDEIWFPDRKSANYTQGRKICAHCPVAGDCLKFALTHRIEYGMFGGTTPAERKQMLADTPQLRQPKRTSTQWRQREVGKAAVTARSWPTFD
jgi:WhiB family transcriptional regulator, redox-sensing transcriptional regulator